MKQGLFIILTFLFISCTKEKQPQGNCEKVMQLSYKYSLPDTVLIRIDTLDWYPGERVRQLCDSTLKAFKMAADTLQNTFRICALNEVERIEYIYNQ